MSRRNKGFDPLSSLFEVPDPAIGAPLPASDFDDVERSDGIGGQVDFTDPLFRTQPDLPAPLSADLSEPVGLASRGALNAEAANEMDPGALADDPTDIAPTAEVDLPDAAGGDAGGAEESRALPEVAAPTGQSSGPVIPSAEPIIDKAAIARAVAKAAALRMAATAKSTAPAPGPAPAAKAPAQAPPAPPKPYSNPAFAKAPPPGRPVAPPAPALHRAPAPAAATAPAPPAPTSRLSAVAAPRSNRPMSALEAVRAAAEAEEKERLAMEVARPAPAPPAAPARPAAATSRAPAPPPPPLRSASAAPAARPAAAALPAAAGVSPRPAAPPAPAPRPPATRGGRNLADRVQALFPQWLPSVGELKVANALVCDQRESLIVLWRAHRARFLAVGELERAVGAATVVHALEHTPQGQLVAAHVVTQASDYLVWLDLNSESLVAAFSDARAYFASE